MKISSKLQLAGLIVFVLLAASTVIFTSRATSNTTTSTSTYATSSDISLESYCKDGWYQIPGEKKCSRAPKCGGLEYDEVAKKTNNNYNTCMEQTVEGRGGTGGCEGYVPVCCYEVARTGDFTKCVGYWERLWCAKSQCDEARSKGASDSQCGDNCQCSHAHAHYCGEGAQPVPLAQRLGIAEPTNAPQPTNTPIPTNAPPTSTNTPVPPRPTHTTAPNQPTNTPVPNAPTSVPTNAAPTSVPSANQPIGINPQVPTNPNIPQQVNLLPDLPSKQEVIANLDTTTAKPLAVVNASYNIVVSADQQLESFAESWIDKLRTTFLNIFK